MNDLTVFSYMNDISSWEISKVHSKMKKITQHAQWNPKEPCFVWNNDCIDRQIENFIHHNVVEVQINSIIDFIDYFDCVIHFYKKNRISYFFMALKLL